MKGELDNATAAMAKYWTTDALGKVADRCLQLFGGYGYMDEFPISRIYRDARVMRIYAGHERNHEAGDREELVAMALFSREPGRSKAGAIE